MKILATTPTSIHFSDEVLTVPSFAEVGVPEDIAMLGLIKGLASVGQWINRGDPLATAVYHVFNYESRRLWGLVSDPLWSHEITLRSPVAGLVVDLREEVTTEFQPWGVYYERRPALPIILLPQDEPPQEYGELSYYREVGSFLQCNWRCLRLYVRGEDSFIRLHEQAAGPANAMWRDHLERLKNCGKLALGRFAMRKVTSEDRVIIDRVNRLRTQDLVLRDKLLHIARLASETQQ